MATDIVAWARARPLHATALALGAPVVALLFGPLLLGLLLFAAPALVPALLFCAVGGGHCP